MYEMLIYSKDGRLYRPELSSLKAMYWGGSQAWHGDVRTFPICPGNLGMEGGPT
jgi:hypothetical protein